MGTSFLERVELGTKGFGRCVIVSWWKRKVRGIGGAEGTEIGKCVDTHHCLDPVHREASIRDGRRDCRVWTSLWGRDCFLTRRFRVYHVILFFWNSHYWIGPLTLQIVGSGRKMRKNSRSYVRMARKITVYMYTSASFGSCDLDWTENLNRVFGLCSKRWRWAWTIRSSELNITKGNLKS